MATPSYRARVNTGCYGVSAPTSMLRGCYWAVAVGASTCIHGRTTGSAGGRPRNIFGILAKSDSYFARAEARSGGEQVDVRLAGLFCYRS